MHARSLGLFAAALALAATLTAGCEPVSCEKVCEKQSKCSGATAQDDCAAACAADLKGAQEAGCEDEYNSRIDCLGTLDACAASSFCGAQDAAYLKCMSDHATGTTTTSSTN